MHLETRVCKEKEASGRREMKGMKKGARAMQNATLETPERLNATLDEAAEYLGVSKRTIQMWQERGLLRPVRFGKLRRFRWAQIREIEKNGVE